MKRNDLPARAGEHRRAAAADSPNTHFTRRAMLHGGLLLVASMFALPSTAATRRLDPALRREAEQMYSAIHGEPFPIPAVDIEKLNPAYFHQLVDYQTEDRLGTVIVDTHSRVLYLTLEAGKAIRYGVVAYCRGSYCVMAFEAVAKLRDQGFNARRREDDMPEWIAAGFPFEAESS